MNITDEMLMAYADGELSREDCRRLEAMLGQDAGLRARLEPFAVTGSSLANVFDQPMREPIPDRLLAVITAGGRRAGAARERQVGPVEQQATGIFDAIADALFPRGLGFAGAFTLTALVAAVGTAGYLAGSLDAPASGGGAVVALGDGDLVAGRALKVALETQPGVGDDKTALKSGAALWPGQTFRSHNEGFCREYKIAGVGGNGFAGVACRGGDSEWHVAVHAEFKMPVGSGDQSAAKQGQKPEYESAGRAESPSVEAAIEALKQGDVFGRDEEAAAIANGWSATK